MSDAGIGFGERVPEFRRHDAQGRAIFFYDLADGRPTLLCVLATTDAELVVPALARFAAESAAADLRRVALVPVAPPALLALAGPPSSVITVLADDGAVSGFLLGDAATRPLLTVLALDPNQRVLARCDVRTPAALGPALAAACAAALAPPWRRTGVVTTGAPALLIPRVFEPELCDELVALFEREGGDPSGVLELEEGKVRFKVEPKLKMRRDYQRFGPEQTARFATLLQRRVVPEVDKCFAFRATGFEDLKLVRYDDAGGYHRPHRDNATPDVDYRRFAMSINLNSGDYEGGELRFPEFGPERYQPAKGGAVVFSCSLLHEALPVTRGRRYVFLTFLSNDQVRGPHLYHAPD